MSWWCPRHATICCARVHTRCNFALSSFSHNHQISLGRWLVWLPCYRPNNIVLRVGRTMSLVPPVYLHGHYHGLEAKVFPFGTRHHFRAAYTAKWSSRSHHTAYLYIARNSSSSTRATAAAIRGGTALPTCLNCSVRGPSNLKLSAND